MPATPAASLITTAQDSPGVEADDWHAWRNQGSYEARSRLIERHMPFAKMLAAKLYGNRIILEAEFDDYRQWGIEGLIAAVDHFDPDRNVPFEAYSAKRIQGAILNEADTLSDRAAQISMRARIRRERASSVGESADTRADTSTLFNRLVEVAVGLALGVMLEDTGMIQTLEAVAPQTDVYRSVELAQLHKRVQALVELLPERE
ncbi:MAG TPA: sigma factor, partial [Rhodocyclaceae bacterium]|nr:sigma factor [Rhodocyclaceae bacterium]